jgi:hypothetical protein
MVVIGRRGRRLLTRRIVMSRFGRFPLVLRAHEIARSEVQLQQQHRDCQTSDTTRDHA